MQGELVGRRIAVLATDGVEESELVEPWAALRQAGADVVLLAPEPGTIRSSAHGDVGERFQIDAPVDHVRSSGFNGLVLPGGVVNADHLRMDDGAVSFVQSFVRDGGPVAAICHAPWMLIEAGVLRGRTLTSYPSLETDIRNAGGRWVDREVCIDGAFLTSRRPDDLPAFCRAMVDAFAHADANAGDPEPSRPTHPTPPPMPVPPLDPPPAPGSPTPAPLDPQPVPDPNRDPDEPGVPTVGAR